MDILVIPTNLDLTQITKIIFYIFYFIEIFLKGFYIRKTSFIFFNFIRKTFLRGKLYLSK